MNIRPEMPRDYADIAEVQIVAFGGRIAESLIVTLLRQRREFDPELSLVAEEKGEIVGHALFSPQTIRLLGQDVRAVNLAPIGVEPDFQGKGIGGALIEEGHRLAREKGYTVSFLLGHDTYYPRFAYKTGVYGASSVEVSRDSLPLRDWRESPIHARSLFGVDTPALFTMWPRAEGEVDFAVYPGGDFLDWISPHPSIQSMIYLRDGVHVGYVRFHRDEPHKPRMFFATNADAAQAMAAMLMGDQPSITLPLHPYSRSAAAFDMKPTVTAWNAAMACSLAPGPFDEYYAQLQAGKRLPGRVIWPVAFDLA